MGISSNQARLMTLTARQHDLELRAQQISAEKMIKGLESQEAAMKYSKALNTYNLLKKSENVIESNSRGAFKVYSDGTCEWISDYSNVGTVYFKGYYPDLNNDAYVVMYRTLGCEEITPAYKIKDGATPVPGQNFYYLEDVDYTTSEEYLQEAKAQYDEFTASVSTQEKLLDMELTQINTEHSAVKTEYDSVKGLIGENVDKSFNVFG